ncbi:SprT family zinc-dependent metalloprotease [Sphingomonas sp. BIUV-7]|uniref:SprT family zinc-dependent metalloprotease n=1 Tax=Sphingomonas natans TaxID=3063330 RepID=A0ABT8YCD0_9SPHN|nr:SprT family zinc-dependent metalloprotease [Sphingomonas sp. BIUV-7]MDO6415987.1 SprT family zinc-dependent metalloprotease [Sphingomonas sp. BIUV-7]
MSSEPSFADPQGGARTLQVRRSARARRMRLVVDPRDGAVKLTLPARANLVAAFRWAESKRDWIEATIAALPPPAPLADGATIPYLGGDYRLRWRADAGRRVTIEGGEIVVGGPQELAGQRVIRWLRAEALAVLSAETADYVRRAGVTPARVGIGDPRTRWGSCSASGDIRYNWRLILAPPEVRRATVAHEVGHRLHMDHSPAFHAAVTRLFGRDPAPERAWLRAHGARLHVFGRG